jgi:hypothetical protein
MMFPQLLPLYWRRMNGVGYTAGMLAGVVVALAQRVYGSHLPQALAFLNEERWLLVSIGLVGLTAAVLGSLLSTPTSDAVLREFYRRTLPFGLWAPHRNDLPADLRRRVDAEHRREIAALPLALVFQMTAFLTAMLAVMRHWEALAASAAIMALAFAALSIVWLRRINESDAIAAEALRVLPSGDTTAAEAMRSATPLGDVRPVPVASLPAAGV